MGLHFALIAPMSQTAKLGREFGMVKQVSTWGAASGGARAKDAYFSVAQHGPTETIAQKSPRKPCSSQSGHIRLLTIGPPGVPI